MSSRSIRARVEDLVQEVDMLVYVLEREPPAQTESLLGERRRMRKELERIRDVLDDLTQEI